MLCLTQPSSTEGMLIGILERILCTLEIAPDGTIINANTNYLAVSGYTPEELIGKNYRQVCTTEIVKSAEYCEFWTKLKRGESISGVFCQQRQNGSLFWLETVCIPMADNAGKINCIVQFGKNITDRMEKACEVENKLDAIDRAMLMAEYSPTGEILTANENFLAVFGYGERKTFSKKLEELFSEDHLGDGTFLKIWDYIRTGHTHSGQVEMRNADGHPVWLESIYAPIFDIRGKLVKVAHFASDISWRIRNEQNKRGDLENIALLIHQAGNAVLVADKNNRVVYMNQAFSEMFGYDEEDIMGRSPTCVFGPHEKKILSEFRSMFETGSKIRSEEITYGRDGQRHWTVLVANPAFDNNGNHKYTVCVFTDITYTKIHEVLQREMLNALTREVTIEEVLKLILLEVERIIPEVIVMVMQLGEDGKLTPLAAPSVPRECMDQVLEISVKDIESIAAQAAVSGDTKVIEETDRDPYWKNSRSEFLKLGIHASSSTPILAADDTPLGAVTFYYLHGRDPDAFHLGLAQVLARLCVLAFEHEKARRAVRQISFYDPVTSLPNRCLLISKTEQLILTRQRRGNNEPVAVMWINIDRFRRINDSLGFEAGNALLDSIGKRLAGKIGKTDCIGRVGADEFAVVLPDCDAERAAVTARRLQKAVSVPCSIEESEVSSTISVGISLYPANGVDVEGLLNNANIAMTLARKNRRDGVEFFDQRQNNQARANISMESCLRHAIQENRLQLRYQPQVYFADGRLRGAEALSRWSHPDWGDIPPSRFIPLAEESGLIEELSEWVVRESCRQMREWRERRVPVDDISINLSAFNFHDLNLPDRILENLRECGLVPSDIVLELTEGVLLDDDPTTMETLYRARDLGFSLSLDDFGTGFSSLGYLRNLPISAIKLDKVFVTDVHTDETSRKLSQAIMHLGDSLGLTVVVEGVENGEQFELLKGQGFHILQGYFISQPLTAPEFETWVEKRWGRWTDDNERQKHV